MSRKLSSNNRTPLAFLAFFLGIAVVLAGLGLAQAQTTTQGSMFWVTTDGNGNKVPNIQDYDADTGGYTSTHTFVAVPGWTPTAGYETSADQYKVIWNCTNPAYCQQGTALMLTFNDQNIVTNFNVYNVGAGWTPTSYYQMSNGYGRLLWYNTDGLASLWDLDDRGNYMSYQTYGPYPGWTPTSYYGTSTGTNYMLWNNGYGTSSLWDLDSNDDFVNYQTYNASSGWNAYGYSQSPTGAGQLLWSNSNGLASVWNLGYNNTYQGYTTYNNPYSSQNSTAYSYYEYEGGD